MPTTNDVYLQRYDGVKWAEKLGFLTIASNGNIGIGTASASQCFQICSTDAAGPFGIFASSAGQGLTINPNNTAGTVNIFADYLGGSEPKLHLSTYTGRGSSTHGITINTSGQVGIANASPSVALDVTGAAKISSDLTLSGNVYMGGGTYGVFNMSGGQLQLGSLGNVGSVYTSVNFTAAGNIHSTCSTGYSTIRGAQNDTAAFNNGVFSLNGGSATDKVIQFGIASSSGNNWIQSWNNGSVVGNLNLQINGGLVGIGNTAPTAQLDVLIGLNTRVGLIIKGAISQSANLQEWRNSSSTLLASVDSAGKLTVGDISVASGVISATSTTLGLFGVTAVTRPTTSVTAATFVANTSAISNDTATWGGYTIGQIVAALKSLGALT